MILLVHRLFETDRAVLTRWQRRAEHLLVDEYQDTNRVQYLLVRALSAASDNLCVVGDEDQSIYPLARRRHSQHSGFRAGFSEGADL